MKDCEAFVHQSCYVNNHNKLQFLVSNSICSLAPLAMGGLIGKPDLSVRYITNNHIGWLFMITRAKLQM